MTEYAPIIILVISVVVWMCINPGLRGIYGVLFLIGLGVINEVLKRYIDNDVFRVILVVSILFFGASIRVKASGKSKRSKKDRF